MLKHRNIDKICVRVTAMMLVVTCMLAVMSLADSLSGAHTMGYESRLFDQQKVHAIDIQMDDWEGFLDTCTSEEYAECTLVIDGETYGSAAIRGKGNTSLTSVKSYGNDRYSFKVEFDHYQNGRTYHGLDKLSLNNLIQDATFMKDYWAYTLMNKMDVASPLCSFVQITVNGEPWGLYLAVEGVEDSFLQRHYGKAHGELYKPDSMSFGGGRGNGKGFDFDEIKDQMGWENDGAGTQQPDDGGMPQIPEGFPMSGGMSMPDVDGMKPPDGGGSGNGGRGGFGGRGGNDVQLVYTDDDPASYENIFSSAKTDISDADQERLIAAIKAVNEGDTSAVDVDAMMRYLAVHSFLCNDDSYTGMMVHNYYLYEEDGVLSMIPWDYNLAFGGFSGGKDATGLVNRGIDEPVTGGSLASRPMVAWIFDDAEYQQRYHELYQLFLDEVFESGWFASEYARVTGMIDPYVQADENAFYSYEEFQTACVTLAEFCSLRAQSVQGQLNGSIPSCQDDEWIAEPQSVNADHLDLSALGGMGGFGGKGGRGGGRKSDSFSGREGTMPADAPEDGASDQAAFPSFNPGEMPAGFPNADAQMFPTEGFSDAEKPTVDEFPEMANQTSADAVEQATGERPGSFSPPSMNRQQEETIGYSRDSWLLLASVLVMATGLWYAHRFRSRL